MNEQIDEIEEMTSRQIDATRCAASSLRSRKTMKRPSAAAAAFVGDPRPCGDRGTRPDNSRSRRFRTGRYVQWFDDNLADRSVGALTRQTDLLYNRVALPFGAPVTAGASATTAQRRVLVDFNLNSKVVCTAAEAVYGPTPVPSESPTPMPAPT